MSALVLVCTSLLAGCFSSTPTRALAVQFDNSPPEVLTLRFRANETSGPVVGWLWFETTSPVFLQAQQLSGDYAGPLQTVNLRAVAELAGDSKRNLLCLEYVTKEHECYGRGYKYSAKFVVCSAPGSCKDIDPRFIEAKELADPSGVFDPQTGTGYPLPLPQLLKRLSMGVTDARTALFPATETERKTFAEQLAQYPAVAKLPRARFLEAEEKRKQALAAQQKKAAEEREKDLRKQRLVRQQRAEQIAKWRMALRVGTQTFCGRVIEVRAPMVKIAVRSDVLQPGLPSEQWLEVNEVFPPTFGCRHAGGQLSAIEE